jgi:hypothetical protein
MPVSTFCHVFITLPLHPLLAGRQAVPKLQLNTP